MSDSIKIRSQQRDGYLEIKVLLRHVMENGRNRDANGDLIPAHFIRQLKIALDGKIIIRAELGTSISKDPFFSFRLPTTSTFQKCTVDWIDNLGFSDSFDYLPQVEPPDAQ